MPVTEPGRDARAEAEPVPAEVPAEGGGFAQQLAGALMRGEDGRVDLLASMGGVRGLLEAVLPFTVFSVVWGITTNLTWSIVAALVPAVALAIWRLVARETLTQAIGGVLGVALGAWLAHHTGRAESFFLPSLIKNSAYGGVFAISALVGWPLIGVMLGAVLGEGTGWRQVPARRRAYLWATWLWAAMFALRLAIQIPLYLAHQTVLLGAINVLLGLPLFGVAILLCWLILRRVPLARPDDGTTGDSADQLRPAATE